MKKLQKVTLQYVALEDRLLLLGVDEDGQTLRMWLTQRLLQRVLPVYFKVLGMEVGQGGSPAHPSKGHPASDAAEGGHQNQPSWEHRESLGSELMQGFAQQRARLNRPALAPVGVDPASPVFLIHKVDVGRIKEGAALTFVGESEDDKARLLLSGQAVRHWINGLYDVCVHAQWALTAFPDWVAEAANPSTPTTVGASLH